MSDRKNPITGFGLADMKREGGVANPDAFTWECDLNKCEACRTKYLNWKQQYLEENASPPLLPLPSVRRVRRCVKKKLNE